MNPWDAIGITKQQWRVSRRLHWLNKYAEAVGCKACESVGITFSWPGSALHFDHDDPLEKLFGIKQGGTGSSALNSDKPEFIKALIKEVRKCTIRCANHHAIHSKLNNHYGNNKNHGKHTYVDKLKAYNERKENEKS